MVDVEVEEDDDVVDVEEEDDDVVDVEEEDDDVVVVEEDEDDVVDVEEDEDDNSLGFHEHALSDDEEDENTKYI